MSKQQQGNGGFKRKWFHVSNVVGMGDIESKGVGDKQKTDDKRMEIPNQCYANWGFPMQF